jgi:hypothetical protein
LYAQSYGMSQTNRPSALRSRCKLRDQRARWPPKSGVRRHRRRSRRILDRETRDSPATTNRSRPLNSASLRCCAAAMFGGDTSMPTNSAAGNAFASRNSSDPVPHPRSSSRIGRSRRNMLEHDVAHPIRPLRWRGAGLCGKSACGVARHTDSNSTRAGVLNANRSGRSLMYSRNLR